MALCENNGLHRTCTIWLTSVFVPGLSSAILLGTMSFSCQHGKNQVQKPVHYVLDIPDYLQLSIGGIIPHSDSKQ